MALRVHMRDLDERDMRRVKVVLTSLLMVALVSPAAWALTNSSASGRAPQETHSAAAPAGATGSLGAGHDKHVTRTQAAHGTKRQTARKATRRPATAKRGRQATPRHLTKSRARKARRTSARPTRPAPAPASGSGSSQTVSSSYVTMQGTQLSLDGKPWHFTGVNMYQGMSDFPVNRTCGTTINNLDAAFAALPAGSVVRVWAYQSQAYNNNGQLDWSGFDRFINAASAHGIKLDMALGDEAGVCDDDHFKDQAWFGGDYTKTFDDWPSGDYRKGEDPVSWWDWIHLVVPRYANNPTIAFWEPLNEPETANCDPGYVGQGCYGHGSCPGGNAELLRDWFTTVGSEIHKLAPRQLVASGTIGNGECGDWQQYYAMMASSPGLDVLTVHDYTPSGIPGNMQQHIDQATAANKPIVWEEVGTDAGPSNCTSTASRASGFAGKIHQLATQSAVAGFLAWNWIEQRGNGCDLEIDNSDPLMAVLRAGWTTS